MRKTQSRKTRRTAQRRPGWLLPTLAGALVLGAVALLAWRSAASPAADNADGTPQLKANQEKVDLGDVRLGQWVSAAFVLTNTGEAPLRFTEAPYIEVVEGC